MLAGLLKLAGDTPAATALERVAKKNGGDPFQSAAVPLSLPESRLFLHRVVKLFAGLHHVLMRLLNVIELLLLIRIEQRTDLRQRAVHHRFHFLHRLLVNGGDLRFSCVEDRLDLRLLISGQVQLVGHPLQAKRVAVPGASATRAAGSSALRARLCLYSDKAAKRDRTGGNEC